jgi:hypothetical protein
MPRSDPANPIVIWTGSSAKRASGNEHFILERSPSKANDCRATSPRSSRIERSVDLSSAMIEERNKSTGSRPARYIAMKRGMSRDGTHEPM